MTTSSGPFIRPFLKWPGGKFRLLPVLQSIIPHRPYLVEPFVGAGALFINSSQSRALLNDINPDLINLYRQAQGNNEFISEARRYFTSKNNHYRTYYLLRECFNQSQDKKERAYLFLYLNRHGYNGLCRYNLKGHYNVPFGDYHRPYFPEKELETFILRANDMIFSCQDYAAILKTLLKLPKLNQYAFYCDPPYVPLTKTANFTGYSGNQFNLEDQKKLAAFARALSEKGAFVLISNHDTSFTRWLYQDAIIHKIHVSRTISCNTKKRTKVPEMMACYFTS